ncbi:MAG: amidohydrolase family protein [Actinobacteria bacterium]|nr:amidohydrolase family protein [Actinomycetota bacterium]
MAHKLDSQSTTALNDRPKHGLIDCDVHPHLAHGLGDLTPYLPATWQRRIGIGEEHAWSKEVYAAHVSVPKNVFYINTAGVLRRDAVPPDDSIPGSDPGFVGRHLLDKHDIARAVLIGGDMLGLGALPDPDLAAVLASAYNDWLSDAWLDADERYRAAMVVAPRDPVKGAEEIRRVAGRRGFVSVLLPLTDLLMGERHYYPIYEAAAEHELPIAIHPNSVDGIFVTAPRMAGGTPTYYVEWHTGLTQVFQANVISLICHGVFERFPKLKVVVTEGGFGWLPDVIWRLDKNVKGLRDETPWVKRAPSDYVFDHVRFTTQPFVEPKRPEQLHALCEVICAERTLMFSSDYPHWDFDDPVRALAWLPEETRRRVRSETAIELYGGRL